VITKGAAIVAAWLVILVGVMQLLESRRALMALVASEFCELSAYAAERR